MKQRHRASDISFREKNRRGYQSRAFLLLGGVLLVLVIIIFSIGFTKTKNALFSFSGSLFKVRAAAIDGITTESAVMFESKKSIVSERDALRQKVADLEAQVLSLSALKDENQKLQEMLSRNTTAKEQILGRVIVKPNQSIYDTLIVDAGSQLGVIVGARVFARGDIVMGTVIETSTTTAKIKLFTTGGEKTKAVLVGKDIFIDLIGRGGGTFEATLPRDVAVEKGTEVVLPVGHTVIAIAEESIVDPRDPFQKILFRSPVNLFELRYVSIEK